ncbi:hypothetical protein MPRI_01050 [Mycobacterium paraintracellulare]|uniref:Uncharacterized protein n=1 Tax=Mycobacterium paraintracellulare TaxID=1138383 RepID=A0ABN6AFV7_9MYCO|nr:hypothetical protein MPRI_01050 [Mycobacterium paraintracellulare]BCP16446.1 hypothetical protein MINTM021_33550 [Mycobacterium paraintracellulare]
MMGETIRYVVVCGCTGSIEPIAFIEDHRPSEHPQSALRGFITVTGPSTQAIVSGLASTMAIPQDEANTRRKTANVSEIFWSDGHVEWTLRCLHCSVQVQMHRDRIRATVDRLAVGDWQVLSSPDGDEPEPHIVPLGVLCTMVAQQNG